MIGAEAGEVMAVVQTAMLADLPYPAAPRRGHRPSDDGGGARPALRERAASLGEEHAEKHVDGYRRWRGAIRRKVHDGR